MHGKGNVNEPLAGKWKHLTRSFEIATEWKM